MNCYIIDKEKVFQKIALLSTLSEKDKAINSGLRKASTIIKRYGRTSFRTNHKSKTGNLLKSIGTLIKRKRIGSLTGFRRGVKGGNHAHLIDSGTERRYTKRGYYRGKISGSNFWRKAVVQSETQAVNALYDGIDAAINKILTK